MTRIIHLTIEGPALGFDTGLDSQAFAQAKMAQFINQPGYIVYPAAGEAGPRLELWRAAGVAEREGTMVVYGPDFPGLRFEERIEAGGGPALEALVYWLSARRFLLDEKSASPPWPVGTLIIPGEGAASYPPGTILIPPERLLRRTIAAEGDDAWLLGAERWTHPEYSGGKALAFTGAALLYRILSGAAPYQSGDLDTLHEDIMEGVFPPLEFAAPGLNEDAAALIAAVMAGISGKTVRPVLSEPPKTDRLDKLIKLLEAPDGKTRSIESFFHPLSAEELAKLEADREQRRRNVERSVKTKRFVRRNTAILTAAAAGVLVIGLIAGSIIQGQKDRPTTKGMSPQEVVETYYNAITALDHTLMEACVTGKAGKEDISLVTNTFVISKVRQAYEMTVPVLTPQEWRDMGSPPTDLTVFGVSDLAITAEETDESDGQVSYRAQYRIWLPQSYSPEEETAPGAADMPVDTALTDTVTLSLRKNAWRISGIERRQ